MKKVLKRLAMTVLTLSVVLSNSSLISVQAITNTSNDISAIETIARNAPQFVLGSDKEEWSDVAVVNYKPLYDFNDKLIAYSLDLKSNINDEKAFVIISTSEEDSPIIEFGIKTNSPYDKIDNNKTCIFDGIQGYYSHETSTGKYHDIVGDKSLEDEEIKIHVDNSKNKKYVSTKPDISKKNRLNLAKITTKKSKVESTTSSAVTLSSPVVASTASTSAVTAHILANVPDYSWYHGCAPTSGAMILKYLYSSKLSSLTQYTLTDELVTAMNTTLPAGSTSTSNIAPGLKKVMAAHGVSVSTQTYSGKTNATYARAVSQIDLNRPFELSLIGSTETAPGYPNGFGNHSMACVGYNTTGDSYLVVHDTAADGYVYCSYTSSSLGVPYYDFVN